MKARCLMFAAILLLVISSSAHAQIGVAPAAVDATLIDVVAAKTLPVATTPYGPVAVPKDAQFVSMKMESTQHLDPTVMMTVNIEVSYNNGLTWAPLAGATRQGGIYPDDDGKPETTVGGTVELQQVGNPNRQVRGTIAVTKNPVATLGGQMAFK